MRILMTFWDGGEGHMARVAYLARLLGARGHECMILASGAKVARVHQLAPAAQIRQVENRPEWARSAPPTTPTYSHAFRHAQRRLALGFDDENFVTANVRHVILALREFRPHVLVNDYHDTARIAADAVEVPVISIAMAHGLRSGPAFGAWRQHELRGRPLPECLDSFNHARSIFGLDPYQDERETFEGGLNMVPTCPVLDPLRQRGADVYVGPIMNPPVTRGQRRRRRPLVVSYLAEGNNRPHSNYPEVLAQVAAGERAIDFAVLGGPRYERWFANGGVFLGQVDPERYLELIDQADLVITHGGTTLVHALERSVPVLCLPWNSSEAAWAARTEQLGSGMLYPAYWEPLEWRIDLVVHPTIQVAGHWSLPIAADTLRQAIHQLLDDAGYRRAAAELSQRLAEARSGTDLVAMVQEAVGNPSGGR